MWKRRNNEDKNKGTEGKMGKEEKDQKKEIEAHQ